MSADKITLTIRLEAPLRDYVRARARAAGQSVSAWASEALRQAVLAASLEALGVPGRRDPKFPCENFAPGKPGGDCQGDGHYLCGECSGRESRGVDGQREHDPQCSHLAYLRGEYGSDECDCDAIGGAP